jgi:ABC-type polysaccharide/polyol phosphate export permease
MDSTWPNLVSRRDLLRALVVSELRSASAESRLGWLWWLIDPLIMMLIYWGIVVGIFGRGGHYKPYPVFVLCALLPWKHLQSALTSAAKLLRLNEGVIKAIPFPTIVLPLANVIAGLAYFVAGLVVLLGAALVWGCPLGFALVQLPALMGAQLLLVTSCSLVATSFGALIRDLSGFLTHITRVLFYFCPTLYGLDLIYERAAHLHKPFGTWLPALYMLNPFAILIEGYRRAIFYGDFLAPHHWAVLTVECLVFFVVGQRIYRYYDRRVIKFL